MGISFIYEYFIYFKSQGDWLYPPQAHCIIHLPLEENQVITGVS